MKINIRFRRLAGVEAIVMNQAGLLRSVNTQKTK